MKLFAVMRIAILLGVGVTGAGVVLTRDPLAQAVAVSFFGLVLAILFFVYQAPDVALSQITINAIALPLLLLLALTRIRRDEERRAP